MSRKYILLFIFIGLFFFTAHGVDVSAKSAILYEASSGKILYQKDIYTQREIASTTKIMTALLAFEHVSPNDTVIIKPEYTGIEGTSIYLKPGEKVTVNTLLHGLMLQSGNDAAVALAGHVAGDVPCFVEMMNNKAKSLELSSTNFKNPNGLPADGHYSTAYDMAKLTAYAMQLPEFRKLVSSKSYQAEGRAFVNHNKLLKMSDIVDGVKTGFTKSAGRCLVSSAEKDGMRLIAVTLSAPNDWEDHLALYDYGYSAYSKHIFIKAGQEISDIPVISGINKTVSVAAVDELSVVLPQKQSANMHVEIYLPRFLYAPIDIKTNVGEIRLIQDGKVLSKTPIISLDGSEVIKIKTFWDKTKDFFANLF